MNKFVAIVCVASAIAFTTAGCAAHADSVALGAGAPYDGYYDSYYDGFYGPYFDGYWGADGFFYFSDGRGRHHRDDGHHFSHEPAGGLHGIHAAGGGSRFSGGGPRVSSGFGAGRGGFGGGHGGSGGGGGERR